MSDDTELLRRYAEDGSEAAFGELVRQRIDFVYAIALRQVGNDAHLACDVTQVVFVDLALKARALVAHPTLASWLYTSTRFAAAKARRRQLRWHKREQESLAMNEILPNEANDAAWTEIRPVLDDAMHELAEQDRTAIILRYFEGLPLADVGKRLGLAENSARMRVERALKKLRHRLAKRGIVSTAAALGSTLAAQPEIAAPAGLSASVTGAAVAAGMATGIGSTTGLMLMTTQTKIVAATALLAALAGLGGYQWKSRQIDTVGATTPEAIVAPMRLAVSTPDRYKEIEIKETPAVPASSETARVDAVQTLREQGATVQVRLFDSSGKFIFSPEAKAFFRLTDDEAEKLIDAFKLHMQEIKEVARQMATISSNDGQTIVVTVPPEPGQKIRDQFERDVAQIVGPERATEFLEMGAFDITVRLSNDGTGGRTLDISRTTPLPPAEGMAEQPLFRVVEHLDKSITTGFVQLQSKDGSNHWLSKFSPELNQLTITGPKPGMPDLQRGSGSR